MRQKSNPVVNFNKRTYFTPPVKLKNETAGNKKDKLFMDKTGKKKMKSK